jgi:hypothetical protein
MHCCVQPNLERKVLDKVTPLVKLNCVCPETRRSCFACLLVLHLAADWWGGIPLAPLA